MTRQEALAEANRLWPGTARVKVRSRSPGFLRYAVGHEWGKQAEWFYGDTWEKAFQQYDFITRLHADQAGR